MYPSHSNQMNGVPVKISEKYKPPKKLTLNQALVQRLANTEATQQLINNGYDFGLERDVLQKMVDRQQQRQQEHEARRERTRLRVEERQKLLEAKQKQMLTDVSYPSAEDLSSDEDTPTPTGDEYSSGGHTVDHMNRVNAAAPISVPAGVNSVVTATPTTVRQMPFSPPSYCDRILEPTVMAMQHKRNKSIGKSPNINYSDFEYESSPFDNVELKTINDLDILAQVLNITATIQSETLDDNAGSKSAAHINNSNAINTACYPNNGLMTQSSPIPQTLSAVTTTSTVNSSHLPANGPSTISPYQQQYSYAVSQPAVHQPHPQQQQQQQQQQLPPNHHQHKVPVTTAPYYAYATRDQQMSPDTARYQMTEYSNATPNGGWSTVNPSVQQSHPVYPYAYAGSPHTVHGPYGPTAAAAATTTAGYQPTMVYDQQHMAAASPHTKIVYSATQQSAPPPTASKSKSVPDIIRELKAEHRDAEGKRVRNHSQSEKGPSAGIDGNANQHSDTPSSRSAARAIVRQDTRSSRSFSELPPAMQRIATNISAMGFPSDRVARIIAKIGNDEKKIIDHLISMGELLDLGLDELKISDALLKFDNNKDRALDYLIS